MNLVFKVSGLNAQGLLNCFIFFFSVDIFMLSKIAEESSDKAIQPVGPSSTSNVSIKNCHLKG